MASTAKIHQSTPSSFAWTPAKKRAIPLVAADELTDVQIAAAVGVSRRALATWKRHPDFAAAVGGAVGELQAAMLRLAIAKKRKRLEVLDDLHRRTLAVVEARARRYAADPTAPDEAKTGMVVREEVVSRKGVVTIRWCYDAAVPREVCNIEEQAAKELGQWVERSEVGGTVQLVRIVGAEAEAI
jgi:hypothetical protein